MAIIDKKIGPKYKSVSLSAAANNEVVAAVAGKRIRVLSYVVNAAGGANTLTWKSASTSLSGAMDIGSDVTVAAEGRFGLMETAVGEALNLTMSAATLVAGHLTYILV